MMTEDLDEFLDTDDFAVPGTIGASTVNGIFDNGYGEALDYAAGTKPTFLCKTADLPSITEGTTTVTIGGTAYVIAKRQPDGHGLETLVLEH
jgi:hypothetical protein